jgi:hypothetical protein
MMSFRRVPGRAIVGLPGFLCVGLLEPPRLRVGEGKLGLTGQNRPVVINLNEAGTHTKLDTIAPFRLQVNQQRIGSFPQEKHLAACRVVSYVIL